MKNVHVLRLQVFHFVILACIAGCAAPPPPAIMYPPPAPTAEDYFNSGMNAYNMGNYDPAIESFKGAVSMRPNYLEAHYYLGMAYEKIGQPVNAQREYETCIGIDNRYLPAREALGILLYTQKRFDEAQSHLEAARMLNSVSPAMYYFLGDIYLMKKNCQEAVTAYQKAIQLDSSYEAAKKGLSAAQKLCRPSGATAASPPAQKTFTGGGVAIDPGKF